MVACVGCGSPWENPAMPDDDFKTMEQAVSAELHRLIATTEIALRQAQARAGSPTGVSDEERFGALVGALTGISNVIIGLARAVDRLDRRYPGSSGEGTTSHTPSVKICAKRRDSPSPGCLSLVTGWAVAWLAAFAKGDATRCPGWLAAS